MSRPRPPRVRGVVGPALAALAGIAATLGLFPAAVTALIEPRADPPAIEIVAYSVAETHLGADPYLAIRGTIRNRGPGLAAGISIKGRAFETPGGPALSVPGYAEPLLSVLAEGEISPFSVWVHGCCPEGRGYSVTATADTGARDRYRGLEASGATTRSEGDRRQIYGEMRNTGAGYPDISGTRANAVFWRGDDIVDVLALAMPVSGLGTGASQSLGPGQHLPFRVPATDQTYDRFDFWFDASPLPEGVYPLPLGWRGAAVTRDGAAVVLQSDVFNCGVKQMGGLLALVEGRAADGLINGFLFTAVDAGDGLAPGGQGRLEVRWEDGSRVADSTSLTAYVHALETQAFPSGALPCLAPRSPRFLPALGAVAGASRLSATSVAAARVGRENAGERAGARR